MKFQALRLLILTMLALSCGDSTGGEVTPPEIRSPGPMESPAGAAPLGPKGSLQFADDSFSPVAEAVATHRLERIFVESLMMVEGVPTYDQGMAMKATQTPLDSYTFNYYRLDDDSLAFSVETTVLRSDASQYTFSGVGIWYDRDLVPTARGTFEGGQRHGEYEVLDEDGNVRETILYDRGKRYDPERFAEAIHRPLVGEWQSETDNGSSVSRLVNSFHEDGTMTLFTIRLNKNAVLGGDDGLLEASRTDPTTWSWKYTARDQRSGDVEFFLGNTLQGRSRLTFDGKDSFESRIVYHVAPSLVGKRYSFQRVP